MSDPKDKKTQPDEPAKPKTTVLKFTDTSGELNLEDLAKAAGGGYPFVRGPGSDQGAGG